MEALIYLSCKKFKNALKQFIKPKYIIMSVAYLAIILFCVLTPTNDVYFEINNNFLLEISWFLFVILSFSIALNMLLSGVTTFTKSDIDYVICSPLKKQNIFLFGLFQKYKKTIGILLFLFIGLSISINNITNISANQIFAILVSLSWLLFLSFFALLILLRHLKLNEKSKLLLWIFVFAYLVLGISLPVFNHLNILSFSFWQYFVPFCGWAQVILKCLISANNLAFSCALLFILLTISIALTVIRKLDFSCFYRNFMEKPTLSYDKKTHNKYFKDSKIFGNGGLAIISKQYLEAKRINRIPFLDIGTLIISAFVAIIAIGLTQTYTEDGNKLPPIVILSLSLILLALFAVLCFNCTTLKKEISHIHIHLFPISAIKKTVLITIVPTIRHYCVAVFFILIISFISKATISLFFSISIMYLSITLLLVSVNILFIRLFGDDIDEAFGLWIYLKFLMGIVAIIPSILIATILFIAFDNSYIAFLPATIFNVIEFLLICKICSKVTN